MILPLLLAIAVLASLGIGMFLASLNIKYRDVRYALPFVIQIMMYVTPVIYPVSMLDNHPLIKTLMLWLNPISGVISNARAGVLGTAPVDWRVMGISRVQQRRVLLLRPVLLPRHRALLRRHRLSMSRPIIEIQGIGKRYRIGATKEPYLSLRGEVAKRFSPAARRARAAEQEFWALKDVSFSVEPGEAVGIIGRNGAGKSTLLKILSRITPPTEGKITMRGRVGSLLEVGTGFHPELTGRENIYLNGAILGMSRREIARKFDEIVAFAEIEKFLDTPVKRYSSGMYVRLAFAVAAHLEPEILLVDEVLAVGDAAFQKKCLGKMGEVAKGGRTVLFVSHNMVAVEGLCQKAVLLDHGKLVLTGAAKDIISSYLGLTLTTSATHVWPDEQTSPGNEVVRLHKASVRIASGSSEGPITVRTPILMEFEYWNLQPGTELSLSLYLVNEQGIRVLNTFPVNGPELLGGRFPGGFFGVLV